MKKIIDGKIFDTEKAEKVFSFRRKYEDPVPWRPGYCLPTWEDAEYLKTLKGAYLYYCERRNDLQIVTKKELEKTIEQLDPDRYTELLGELEEG